jgi:cyclopropane-fatty-acyl-phospholipid synthase
MLPLFEIYYRNLDGSGARPLGGGLLRAVRFIREAQGRGRARRNVGRHYDLDAGLFRRFLDEDLHYSCAYFQEGDMTLEAAQRAKCEHVARKLRLRPRERVLDIGSGWGGLGLHLVREWDVDVTGLTLSQDQEEESRRRAEQSGLAHRLRFLREDYRDHEGTYDAVASVGMFEHVGRPGYRTFFDRLRSLLAPEGRALLHTIGRSGPPTRAHNWIRRRIFPGTYIPALSEIAVPLERSGLVLTDVEVWRLHYAWTLHEWNRRFQDARDEFRQRLGERFCRAWEFYLQGCESSFIWGDLVVFQLQLARANHAVPVTRDYLYRVEQDRVVPSPSWKRRAPGRLTPTVERDRAEARSGPRGTKASGR